MFKLRALSSHLQKINGTRALTRQVLVARQEMKDLTFHQVEAVCSFSKDLRREMACFAEKKEQDPNADDGYFSDCDEADMPAHLPGQKVRREFLEEYLLSDKFAEFFDEFKQKIVEGDATGTDEMLPPKGSVPKEVFAAPEDRYEYFLMLIGDLWFLMDSNRIRMKSYRDVAAVVWPK